MSYFGFLVTSPLGFKARVGSASEGGTCFGVMNSVFFSRKVIVSK